VQGPDQEVLPEAESLSAFRHPLKVAIYTPLAVSGVLSVCDGSTSLNSIPNTSKHICAFGHVIFSYCSGKTARLQN